MNTPNWEDNDTWTAVKCLEVVCLLLHFYPYLLEEEGSILGWQQRTIMNLRPN